MYGESLVVNRRGMCCFVKTKTAKRTTKWMKLTQMKFNGCVDEVLSVHEYLKRRIKSWRD